MKILSITSSYRKNGNTERLVSLLEEELKLTAKTQNEIMEIERISLGHVEINACHGCRVCFDKGEEYCPLKDKALSIREKINTADGIILASPVYVEDVNGIMKNWIDRMAFNCHRPSFAGKTAVILTTSGIGSSNHSLRTMKAALLTWGFYIAGQQKFSTGGLMKSEEMHNRYCDKIKTIAGNLFSAIKKQKALKPTLYSLIVFKVQQKYWQKISNAQNQVDYIYWSNKGWLDPGCTFYTDIKTNWLKVKAARLLGSIIAVFFV